MMRFLNKTLNPELIKKYAGTIMLIWFLYMLVPATFIMFLVFLVMGSYTIIDLRLGQKDALLFDALLSAVFFLQHSLLIRRGIKQRLAKFIRVEYYNAFYGLTSGIALLLVLLFWQKSPGLIAHADGILYWMLYLLFFLCFAGFFWGGRSLGSFDTLGVKPLMRYISKRPDKTQKITAKGPYRWVRHPLYLFLIIMFWSCPVLTIDRLIFNIMWTAWMVVATYLEDRDLHREFGSQYSEYSSRVPMLIPYRIPRNISV
jgi:protein-S-isoprenylcysteine O-methyltransferase Ste14